MANADPDPNVTDPVVACNSTGLTGSISTGIFCWAKTRLDVVFPDQFIEVAPLGNSNHPRANRYTARGIVVGVVQNLPMTRNSRAMTSRFGKRLFQTPVPLLSGTQYVGL